MSIQALPSATIRAIGASQVLSDPCSVVKELVENALDAHATTIFVEISANALDIVQVRDNGHGIPPEDRPMLCRRYCTSKMREFSDLKGIGGKWLGFRGEALACAAELSVNLTITTRIEGEEAAAALKVKQDGEIESQERASHPVGTSVRLTNLFSHFPVRKQAVLKGAAKYLAKIKTLMEGYALARPSVRLSLKVLNSRNHKDWIYAPAKSPSVQDAVAKVIGKDSAGQCMWSVISYEDYHIKAFLPMPEADPSKVSNVGHFLSIDSRPVSTRRGILKQVIGTFRDCFRASAPRVSNLKEPFLWMNIDCPAQSYDPNVEPAKDDVLFEDGATLLRAVRALFEKFYPPGTYQSSPDTNQATSTTAISTETRDEIILEESPTTDHGGRFEQPTTWNPNMYSNDEVVLPERSEQFESPAEDMHDETALSALRDISVSNPWIMAKMHASSRAPKMDKHIQTPLRERSGSELNSASGKKAMLIPPYVPWIGPATAFSPVQRAFAADIIPQDQQLQSHSWDNRSECDGVQTASGQSETVSPCRTRNSSSDELDTRRLRCSMPAELDSETASQLPVNELAGMPRRYSPPGPSLSNPSLRKHGALLQKSNGKTVNKPFVSPILNRKNTLFDHSEERRAPKTLKHRGNLRQKEPDLRAALFAPRQHEPQVAMDETSAGEVENLANPLSVHASPVFNRASPLTDTPNAANGLLPREEAWRALPSLADERPIGDAHNLIVTLRTSISGLSLLSATLGAVYLEMFGHRSSGLRQPGWVIPGFMNEAGEQEMQTSLQSPPVHIWEMKEWRAKVLQLLNVRSAGVLGQGEMKGGGKHVDVIAAMKAHAAGRLCI